MIYPQRDSNGLIIGYTRTTPNELTDTVAIEEDSAEFLDFLNRETQPPEVTDVFGIMTKEEIDKMLDFFATPQANVFSSSRGNDIKAKHKK